MERSTGETLTSEFAAGAKRRVDDLVSGMKDQAQKLRTKSFQELWTETVDFVRDNPGKTIIISLTAGVILGSLLRRR